MWNVSILTLFPDIFPGPLGLSVAGRALKNGLWKLNVHDWRRYAHDKHGTIDDAPFGGGGGMVARPDVLGEAIEQTFIPNGFLNICLSPRGELFTQRVAEKFSTMPGINILCSRFEGIDERVISEYKLLEFSIGDYVLSSGDVAALIDPSMA